MSKVLDRNGKLITIGAPVIWYDPDESARDLERIYFVDDFSDEIVYISDDFSEAEVLPDELENVIDSMYD